MTERKVIDGVRSEGRSLLAETEAKELVKQAGVSVVDTKLATSREEAISISQQFGFPLEPRNAISILGKLFRQNLDCYLSAELQVFCLIDFSHAPAAKQGGDFEISQSLANHGEFLLQIGCSRTAL